jgi:glycosyltransferase involved in cell wall biosynthesis
VTVVIPTRDEAGNLRTCLPRLARFREVVVLDSGSGDDTAGVAEAAGAAVVQFRWDGRFPKKRNWYLRNCRPRSEWVLFLDADEFVDDEFCDELVRTLADTSHSGFWITYRNWFLGRPLRYGEKNRKLALFRVGAGEYERTDDDLWSGLDMEVHESPVIAGSVGNIGAVVEHRDDRGLAHWLAKHNRYSTWEAHRLAGMKRDPASVPATLSARQRRKYHSLGSWWLPAAYFLATYVLKRGFLDGRPGLAFAMNKAIYFWQIGLKERELQQACAGTGAVSGYGPRVMGD